MNGLRMRSRKKSKSFWKQMKMNTQQPKTMGHSEGSPEREVHRNTGPPKKDRNISINNLTLQMQELQEQLEAKPRVSRRKEVIMIREELNDIETKRTTQRINKSRSWFFENINKIDKPLSRLIKKKRERGPK